MIELPPNPIKKNLYNLKTRYTMFCIFYLPRRRVDSSFYAGAGLLAGVFCMSQYNLTNSRQWALQGWPWMIRYTNGGTPLTDIPFRVWIIQISVIIILRKLNPTKTTSRCCLVIEHGPTHPLEIQNAREQKTPGNPNLSWPYEPAFRPFKDRFYKAWSSFLRTWTGPSCSRVLTMLYLA